MLGNLEKKDRIFFIQFDMLSIHIVILKALLQSVWHKIERRISAITVRNIGEAVEKSGGPRGRSIRRVLSIRVGSRIHVKYLKVKPSCLMLY